MGSLMAGWDSPSRDRKRLRNRSFTKEEIDAFWKSKRQLEEEHLRSIYSSPSAAAARSDKELTVGEYEAKYSRSLSFPPSADKLRKEDVVNRGKSEATVEDIKKNGWWTRSNWAFLNEPPVIDKGSDTYVSQFHIASMGSSEDNARLASI